MGPQRAANVRPLSSRSFWSRLHGFTARRRRPSRWSRRPHFELLEDRTLLATFHVALTALGGDDSNPGTAADPFRTIQAAINAAAAASDGEDSVLVAEGTYSEPGIDLPF